MWALPFGFLGPRRPSAQCEEGWGPPLRSSHDAGAPPCTRVTFPATGKSPKARQGLCPLESPEGSAKLWEPDAVRFEGWNVSPIELKAITIPYRPFRARLRIAPGYLLPLTQTDLPLWVGGQIGLFSPQATPGSHFLLSIRGAAEEPPRMLEGLSHHNQYR